MEQCVRRANVDARPHRTDSRNTGGAQQKRIHHPDHRATAHAGRVHAKMARIQPGVGHHAPADLPIRMRMRRISDPQVPEYKTGCKGEKTSMSHRVLKERVTQETTIEGEVVRLLAVARHQLKRAATWVWGADEDHRDQTRKRGAEARQYYDNRARTGRFDDI